MLALIVTLATGCRGQVVEPISPSVETKPVAVVEAVPPEQPFVLEDGFESLVFSDFESFAAEANTWSATADGLKCGGKPKGYLYSKQSYQNFTLRLDYRFPRPDNLKDEATFKGNTGFLVYITGEHKLWPICLEVQGKHVQMAAIKENGGAEPVKTADDDVARQQARKPVGQWNSLDIVSKAGALTVSLNGTPISKSDPDFISEGSIGIQAEDHPFEVRRLRLKRE